MNEGGEIPTNNLGEPPPARPILETQYKGLATTLAQCDKLIPKKDLEIWGETDGRRTSKQKEFKAAGATGHIRTVLQGHFPDEVQQGRVVDAANDFLGKIAPNMRPEDKYDTIAFGLLDRFLSGFPTNMIDRLGDKATAETIVRIIRVGSQALDLELEKLNDPLTKTLGSSHHNYAFGAIPQLVGEDIPTAIAQAGGNSEEILARIENSASAISYFKLKDLVAYYQTPRNISPETQARIDHLVAAVREIDPEIDTHLTPFNQPDREPWNGLVDMGQERRVPTWADIGDMVRSGEQDGREYGIGVEIPSQGSDIPVLDYVRGSERQIKNGARRRLGPSVFFHSHPSIRELTSSIISPGDLEANDVSDHGGGFLNIANTNGVTLHLGGTYIEDQAAENRSLHTVYVVESGELKGEQMGYSGKVNDPSEIEKMQEVRRRLQESRQPYIYSAYRSITNMRYYFIHVPWQHIEKSVSFYDLCFGEGLAKQMQGMDDMTGIPQAQNLYEAMSNTSKVEYDVMMKDLEDRTMVSNEETTREQPKRGINFRSRLRFPFHRKK